MNLTEDQHLVQKAEGYGGRARFHQVVYRVLGSREEWLTTLGPGETFRPTLLQRTQTIRIYEVSAETELRYEFGGTFQTHDGCHDFVLEIVMSYRVEDARAFRESVSQDPLRELERYSFDWITEHAQGLPWRIIWEGGATFDQAMSRLKGPDGLTSPKELLHRKARQWGLGVSGLLIRRVLPQNAISPNEDSSPEQQRKSATAAVGIHSSEKVRSLQIESEGRIQEAEDQKSQTRQLRRMDHELVTGSKGVLQNVITMMNSMIDRAGAGVDSFPEMVRAVQQLQQVRDEVGRLTLQLPSDGPQAIPAPRTVPQLMPMEASTDFGSVLEELKTHLDSVPEAPRQDLMPPILHLLAELHEPKPDPTQLEAHHQRCDDALGDHLRVLGEARTLAIRRFTNIETLSKRIGADHGHTFAGS